MLEFHGVWNEPQIQLGSWSFKLDPITGFIEVICSSNWITFHHSIIVPEWIKVQNKYRHSKQVFLLGTKEGWDQESENYWRKQAKDTANREKIKANLGIREYRIN
jgi:hypothetical protein